MEKEQLKTEYKELLKEYKEIVSKLVFNRERRKSIRRQLRGE